MSTHSTPTSSHPSHGAQTEVPPAITKRTQGIGLAIGLGVSIVMIGAASRFHRPAPPEPQPSTDLRVAGTAVSLAPAAPQWKLIELAAAKASSEVWTDPVAANVKVDEAKAARVGSPLAGRVVRVLVELGQSVKAGDPLFAVSSPRLADLGETEMRARVELDSAKTAHERVAALVEARAIPAKELLNAERDLKSAETSYRMAAARLAALKVDSRSDSEFMVKSPRDGVVVEKNVLPGQELGDASESVLMTIADLSSVWVVADLFESNAAGIQAGTPVRVDVASAPGKVIEGRVELVSSIVDPERHTIPVRVRLDNANGTLKPNTFARMQFQVKSTENSTQVAASALVTDGQKQYVYVQAPDHSFARREVVAGSVRRGNVTILAGLAPGETVVQSGAVLLDNQVSLAQ